MRAVIVLGGVAALSAIATSAITLSTDGAPRPFFVGKLAAGGEPDAVSGNGLTTVSEGPATFEAYLSAQRTYPANVIPPAVAAQAESTFDAIAAKDAKNGDPKGKGHKWKQYGPTEDATQPGVLAFSGATNNTASRITALVVDPDCGAKARMTAASGSALGRRRLADGQRAGGRPGLEAAQAQAARPELGRRPDARPDRQEGQHDLPRDRRGESLLVRLRGRRRHLQVDRRRQQLAEARRRVRQQRHVPVREPRRRRFPRTRRSGRS